MTRLRASSTHGLKFRLCLFGALAPWLLHCGELAEVVDPVGQSLEGLAQPELVCPAGSHWIVGTEAADTLIGTGGVDCILGRGGDDVILGRAGDDVIYGEGGVDTIDGEEGNDKIWGGSGDDVLRGGDGDDQLIGNKGDDRLFGDAGNDVLGGNEGNDILNGGTGNDNLQGHDGNDSIEGEDGNDVALGGGGDDLISGGPGKDYLRGGDGNDGITGGGQGDRLEGEGDCDTVDGVPEACGDLCPSDPTKTAPGVCGCDVPDTDSDGDHTPDCSDTCPNDPAKNAPGACGCGISELDTDGDGVPSCLDACPSDPAKSILGICGCGVSDVDTDTDGTADCQDACPADFLKLDPGICGCGTADMDSDGDTSLDCQDGCPFDLAKTSAGTCGCGQSDVDSDADGTPNCQDGCPNDATKLVPGVCGCGLSDADGDGDGIPNCSDSCPTDPAKTTPGVCGCGVIDPTCEDQCPSDPLKMVPGICGCGVLDLDSDADGTADCLDQCPSDSNKTAPGVCGCAVADTDGDGDGTRDCQDACAADPSKTSPGVCGCGVSDADPDGDGTPTCNDGCPTDASKLSPGLCGCGVSDVDNDGDGTSDCNDACPSDGTKVVLGVCGCGVSDVDSDGDGTSDCNDGCTTDAAKTSAGICGCGVSDVDGDGDGTANCHDGCSTDPLKTVPGVCGCGVVDPVCLDNCPSDPNKTEPGICGCGVADTDSDNDGTADCLETGDPVAPEILGLFGPGPTRRGESAISLLTYADANADIQAIRMAITAPNLTQTVELPVEVFGIVGLSGTIELPVATETLGFGAVSVQWTLIDAAGLESSTEVTSFDIVGDGSSGEAPVIGVFSPTPAEIERPVGRWNRAHVSFLLYITDTESDVEWARVVLTKPDGVSTTTDMRAAELGIPPAGLFATRKLEEIEEVDQLGRYDFEISVADRGGRMSDPVVGSVEVVAASSTFRPALQINAFSPTSVRALDQVTITGVGFEAGDNEVYLNEMPLKIESESDSELVVTVPVGSESGGFLVRNARGRAFSTSNLEVAEEVIFELQEANLSVGTELFIESSNRNLVWTVNGVVGGDATFGTISKAGVYVAPASVPATQLPPGAPTPIKVRGALASNPTVFDEVDVFVGAPSAELGRAFVHAAVGVTVKSSDERSELVVPPGALAANQLVTIETLELGELTPPSGRKLVGGATLGPTGTVFSPSATLRVELIRPYAPGTRLAAYFDEGSGWVSAGVDGVVEEEGETALIEVSHFTHWVLVDDESLEGITPLGISQTTVGQSGYLVEGSSTPVHFVGSGLSNDVRIEVLDANLNPTRDVTVGPFHTLGDEGGAMLHARALPGLAENVFRTYYLQLSRPSGASVTTPFFVVGLPELVLSPTDVVQLDGFHTFSTVDVEGVIEVPVGQTLELYVTGRTRVRGRIDARGQDGMDAPEEPRVRPGQYGAPATPTGGNGGLGREDDDGINGPGPENFGGHGSSCFGPVDDEQPACDFLFLSGGDPYGIGGSPADNEEITVLSLINIVRDSVACAGGIAPACITGAFQAVQFATVIASVADGGDNAGWPGLGGSPYTGSSGIVERGGGGGGGGGRMTVGLPHPSIASLRWSGGGGGAGGSGGRQLSVFTQSTLELGDSGEVSSRGGDGGSGSERGQLRLEGLFRAVSKVIDRDVPGFPGGAGGGGTGGSLEVRSGRGILAGSLFSQTSARGGAGGLGGRVSIDPDHDSLGLEYAYSASTNGFRGTRIVGGPKADGLESKVTRRRVWDLAHESSPAPLRSIEIFTPSGYRNVPLEANQTFTRVILDPGWNFVRMDDEPDFLLRAILVFAPDVDADGLADDDETVLGTNPTNPDSDGDGLQDGAEVERGLNPLSKDTDNDGLPDATEIARGTDGTVFDTDGDSIGDGVEVVVGTNPLDANDFPTSLGEDLLLGASGPNLYVLDLARGLSAKLGQPAGLFGYGFTFNRGGVFYTAEVDVLESTNPFTGATITAIGSFHTAALETVYVQSIAYDAKRRKLFGVECSSVGIPTGQLVEVNRRNAEVTRIGAPQASALTALAFASDGKLFAVRDAGESDVLVELDPATGSETQQVSVLGTSPIVGLVFDPTGRLLASRPTATGTDILHLEPAGSSVLGTIPDRTIGAIGFSTKPRPLTATSYAIGADPRDIMVGDMDGDSILDVAVTNLESNDISFFKGVGDGTLQPQVSVPSSNFPTLAAAGDFDEDGLTDWVVCTTAGLLRFYRGVDGGAPVFVSSFAAGGCRDLAAAQVVGSGALDLVVLQSTGLKTYQGNGDGTFVQVASLSTPLNATFLELGDVNGDGFIDVVFNNFDIFPSLGSLRVSLGSDSGFGTPTTFFAGTDPRRPAFGDMDGDGDLDMVASSPASLAYSSFLGDGAGLFTFGATYHGTAFPGAVGLGDVTGDDFVDAIVGSEVGVLVHPGDGAGGFNESLGVDHDLNRSAAAITVKDLNDDGYLDVLAATASGELWVLIQEP